MSNLNIYSEPTLNSPIMVMGLEGWMNGGNVSSGAVECLIGALGANSIADIPADGYYIYNFPGTMEVSSMFRPHTIIEDGIVEEYEDPTNIFWCSEKKDIIFFLGKEPNINWQNYTDAIFEFCQRFNIKTIYYLASVAGLVPHTRDSRYLCNVSDLEMKQKMDKYGLRFADYNGPANIVTHLLFNAPRHNIQIASILAEIPAYVHGRNPKCIESMARHISGILGLGLEFHELMQLGDELEKKLTEIISKKPELAKHISRLEQDYDNDIFDSEMTDLKDWLHKQGIRLD